MREVIGSSPIISTIFWTRSKCRLYVDKLSGLFHILTYFGKICVEFVSIAFIFATSMLLSIRINHVIMKKKQQDEKCIIQ